MKRSNRLTDASINILLEQIDNGNTSEFEENEAEEDFEMVPVCIKMKLPSMRRLFLFSKVTVHCDIYVTSNGSKTKKLNCCTSM